MTTTDENPNKINWHSEWYVDDYVEYLPDIHVACWQLVTTCHAAAIESGHYNDPKTGEPIKYTVPQLLNLVMAELHEALNADIDGAMDKHLPHRLGVEVEIADALIILFGACGHLGLDIGNAMAQKLEYNRTRKDHRERNLGNG